MTNHNEQFDDLERQVSDRFRKDLRGLFEPAGSVPSQVDRAVLSQARARFTKPRRMILRIRWAAGITAAAAVVALGMFLHHGPASSSLIIHHRSVAAEQRLDLDGNGRVDILDAFRLAKGIESRGPAAADWDINGDGRVDRDDVDAVAFAAVRLNAVSVGCAPSADAEAEERCVVRTLPETPMWPVTFQITPDEGV